MATAGARQATGGHRIDILAGRALGSDVVTERELSAAIVTYRKRDVGSFDESRVQRLCLEGQNVILPGTR